MSKDLRGSIDIGSNSILLLIGKFEDETYIELENHSSVTALGRDLDKTGIFHEESMESSFQALKRYADIAAQRGLKPQDIIATATEASRVAQNATLFYEKIKNEIGIEVKIITPDAEAYYSTRGITFNSKFDEEIIHIMDIGGASTEIIKYNNKSKDIIHDFSLPMGAVRLTNWKEENILEEKLDTVITNFSENIAKVPCKKLYCVAGTMTSVGNMFLGLKDFQEKEIHGLCINVKDLNILISKHQFSSEDELLEEFPFLGKRAKTILGGLKVAEVLFDQLGVEEIQISTYGLRYGTLEAGGVANEYIA